MVVAMAEPDQSSSEPDDTDSLEFLKDDGDGADTSSVEDAVGARTRWNWNPVTETGGPPRTAGEAEADRSSFQFDLGGALARFGEIACCAQSTEPGSDDGDVEFFIGAHSATSAVTMS